MAIAQDETENGVGETGNENMAAHVGFVNPAVVFDSVGWPNAADQLEFHEDLCSFVQWTLGNAQHPCCPHPHID